MPSCIRQIAGRIYRLSLNGVAEGGRRQSWKFARGRRIRRYLQNHSIRKLQLGAGFHNPAGWLNSDLMPRSHDTIFLDITRTFPFGDNTFDAILCEHLIEHVPYPEARHAVRECLRVLRPGGHLRVSTPDLLQLLGLYTSRPSDIQKEYSHWITSTFVPYAPEPAPCFVINNAFRNWGHQFLFDEKTLMALLRLQGFTNISRQAPQVSVCSHLAGVDFHSQCIGNPSFNAFESMIIEAQKPGEVDG